MQKLLNGEEVGLKIVEPQPFQQSITVHRSEIGKDAGIEVEGME